MTYINEPASIGSALDGALEQGAAQYQASDLNQLGAQQSEPGGAPATIKRRVRHARARRAIGQGVAGVVAIGVIGWGITTLDSSDFSPTPAAPSESAGESASDPSAEASSTVESELPPLTAADLIATARPRSIDEPNRNLAEPALICEWPDGDNPRTLPEPELPGDRIVASECETVWVGDSRFVNEASYFSAALEDDGTTVTVYWELMNSADQPLTVDRASIAVLLEEGPSDAAPTPGKSVPEVSGLTATSDTFWVDDSHRLTVSGSEVDLVTIAPHRSIEGSTAFTATLDDGEDSLVDRIVRDNIFFTPTATVRVAPFVSDTRDLLLQFGLSNSSMTVGRSAMEP
ncbi:hypothetical protein [Demequina aurantiaca]|uniref:hypothetical protein n=1 Tax=Demequina aurantiaca TaxID=676200 RepID=UPI003D345A17